MLDLQSLPLQADQARAARNYFGLSQAKAAEASSQPLHKIKRFEAGNYIPDHEFLEALRGYYEGRGFAFDDTPEPGAKAKEAGMVFPSGVVGKPAQNHGATNRPQQTMVQHMRIALEEPELGHALDLIDANEDRVELLLQQPVEAAFFGGLTDESQARHAEALKLLAENGALFARLFGRQIGGKPNLEQKGDPKTHADLLHRSQADAHLAVAGSRDAKTRLQARKPAKSLLSALFG